MNTYSGFRFSDIQKMVISNDEHGVPQEAMSKQEPVQTPPESEEAVPTRQETLPTPPEPRGEQDSQPETPARRGRKSAPGRKSKAAPKPAASEELTLKGIYFDNELHMRLKLYCTRSKVSISSFVNSCTDDAVNRSYTCMSPACRCSFSIQATTGDTAPSPSCCPVCGGNSLVKNNIK